MDDLQFALSRRDATDYKCVSEINFVVQIATVTCVPRLPTSFGGSFFTHCEVYRLIPVDESAQVRWIVNGGRRIIMVGVFPSICPHMIEFIEEMLPRGGLEDVKRARPLRAASSRRQHGSTPPSTDFHPTVVLLHHGIPFRVVYP